MELIIQRLKSKTYHVAIVGALLTILETNSGLISQFLPVEYRNYVVLVWPVLMITLREVTTGALSDK
jgi:uncharacterized membrane protein